MRGEAVLVRKVRSITILGVLMALVMSCLGCSGNLPVAKQDSPIKISTEEIKDKKDNLELSLKIPVLSEMKDEKLQQSLNDRFRNLFLQRRDEMLAEREEMAKELDEEDKDNPFADIPYSLASDYKVIYNNNGLLSLYFDKYEFLGGAHGMTYRIPCNIDLRDGSELELSDIFKPDSNYEDLIDKAIQAEIAKNPENYYEPEMGGFKGIEDDQTFTLQPGGITIYFQLSDIAPYAAGIPEFKIPFSEFGDMVDPELQKRLE